MKPVTNKRLLGVEIDQHLQWKDQVKAIISTCFSTLHTVKKIRNFTHYNVRKPLAESLIFSKLDFNDIVFDPLQQYLMKRLQRVQNAAASFELGRHANPTDCINIGWPPVVQRRELHLLKTTFKALNDPLCLPYAAIQRTDPNLDLRSSRTVHLTIPLTKGTFQVSASKAFNQLPVNIRN